jgi:hypothetical protein
VILTISEIWLSISSYLVQSHYRHCHLLIPVIFHPRDLVTCCNFGCNITEWTHSIFPSRGRANPALDAYASTYSIGIPKRHLFSHPNYEVTYGWCNQGSRFLLSQHEHHDTIISILMLVMSIMAFTSIINWHKCQMIGKPRSSVDQWASIRGLLGTLVVQYHTCINVFD